MESQQLAELINLAKSLDSRIAVIESVLNNKSDNTNVKSARTITAIDPENTVLYMPICVTKKRFTCVNDKNMLSSETCGQQRTDYTRNAADYAVLGAVSVLLIGLAISNYK